MRRFMVLVTLLVVVGCVGGTSRSLTAAEASQAIAAYLSAYSASNISVVSIDRAPSTGAYAVTASFSAVNPEVRGAKPRAFPPCLFYVSSGPNGYVVSPALNGVEKSLKLAFFMENAPAAAKATPLPNLNGGAK